MQMRYDTPMSQPLDVNVKPPPGTTSTATPASKTPTTSAVAAAKPSLPSSAVVNASSASATMTLPATSTSIPLTDLPMRQQLKAGLRDMYRSSMSSGKNFAKVGAIFSGTECAIEGLRAKNDLYNGVAGGCLTGGILARNAGPQAVAVGCAGFAVFSAAIDAYMRMPEDERSRPIA
jgi:import inner membrane translocase subunit TIM22